MGYVDYTLLFSKEDEIKYIFDKFSLFHKNLKFINRFEEARCIFWIYPSIRQALITNVRIQVNTVILTVVYFGFTKTCGYIRFITVKGKYLRPQRNLNLKLIRLNCFCHETAIHCTLVILSLAYLEATLNQKEMVTKTTKKAILVCI